MSSNPVWSDGSLTSLERALKCGCELSAARPNTMHSLVVKCAPLAANFRSAYFRSTGFLELTQSTATCTSTSGLCSRRSRVVWRMQAWVSIPQRMIDSVRSCFESANRNHHLMALFPLYANKKEIGHRVLLFT